MPVLIALALAGSLIPGPTPTPTPAPPPVPTSSPRPTPTAASVVAEADAHFARRSEGAVKEVAPRGEVDESIRLYRQARALAPDDIEILAKLMRALHFRGAYTGASNDEKKEIFDEGRKMGQAAVDRLEDMAKSRGMDRIEFLRHVKGAPLLYLWTAGHWGEWGLVRGKFTAARTGVAGKLRDLSQTVIDLDPRFEDAAGYRLLGRLHSEAPKIIFFTGWVNHDKGLEYLRRADAMFPNHPVTTFFLAEAILDHEPGKRAEALRILELCAGLRPRPDTALEDAHYSDMARKRLEELRQGS